MTSNYPVYKILSLLVIAILLLMTLTYPFGSDQPIFFAGAKKILAGGVPYRDFIESKPPVIFYLYAITDLLFGSHAVSIRIFDALYQTVSLFVLSLLLKRSGVEDTVRYLSLVIAAILMVNLGYWDSALTESFVSLPLLLIAYNYYLFTSDGSHILKRSVFIGSLFLFLFLLKFTFIFFLAGFIVFIVLQPASISKGHSYKVLGYVLLTLILEIAAYCVFLYSVGALDNFIRMLQWLQSYADLDPLLSFTTIREQIIFNFPATLFYVFSPLFCIALIYYIIKADLITPIQKYSQWRTLYTLIIWFGIFGLLSIIYERKSFIYHFARLHYIAAPLAAFGLHSLYRSFLFVIRSKYIIRSVIIIIVLLFSLLFYSPLPRLFTGPIQYTAAFIDPNAKMIPSHSDTVETELTQLTQYIRSRWIDRYQSSVVWGNTAEIYVRLGSVPPTFMLTNFHIMARWTSEAWRQRLISDLTQSTPEIFICQQNDVQYLSTGVRYDSYEALKRWRDLDTFVGTRYLLDTVIHNYRIYYKK